MDDIRHQLLLAIGHDVHAGDALDFAHLLDDFDADLLALFLFAFPGRLAQTVDDMVRDTHAGNVLAHILRGFVRAQRADADQNVYLLVQPHITHHLHKLAEARHVIAVLGLDELRSGLHLLRQTQWTPFIGLGKGVSRRAQEQAGWGGQFAPAEEHTLVAHDTRRAQQLDGVEIENALGLRLVAHRHVVPRQAEHVAHAHRRRAQQITLNGNAVAVAARDLKDRLVPGPRQQRANGHTGHVAVCARSISGVNGVSHLRQHQRCIIDFLRVGAIRRVQLSRHRKQPRPQHTFQTAPRCQVLITVIHSSPGSGRWTMDGRPMTVDH